MVVGGSGVDTVVRVASLPVPPADSVPVGPIREYPGHTGGYVALGARALGLRVALLDFVGDDWPGTLVRARMAEGGVEFLPLVSPAGTRRAVNLVDAAGRRMSFYDGRDPAGLRMPREFHLPHLRRARHVHLCISHFARFLHDDLAGLGVPVSTDLHDWDGVADHHREFALRSDLVFLSAAGADGAYVLTRDGGPEPRHVPAAVPPGPVVDSNGAGDAFAAGFLYGRLTGRDVPECARLGAVAGAHACTAPGAAAFASAQALLAAAGLPGGP
ncbi:carbohydrate kinase family protein [Streptomyces sp. URMC 125]|uniref:carbohydrate kinase family protein n=1 Tax=Streptomyces sp. URMC 125 TaxID=3423419 RepID=UPI003F1D2630